MAEVLETCWSVIGDQGMAAGLLPAYSLAAAAISSALTPVIWATRSNGYCLTRCAKASKPTVQSRTKSWSYKPSSMITCSQPSIIAASVPARSGSHRSAASALPLLRGSSTISLAPLACAVLIDLYSSVQLWRRGSWPKSTMHFEFSTSALGYQP